MSFVYYQHFSPIKIHGSDDFALSPAFNIIRARRGQRVFDGQRGECTTVRMGDTLKMGT